MIPFLKMNGAGNDFVIFDARKASISLSAVQIAEIADRKNAITRGCDQVIVMEPSRKADIFMRIFNADGGEVDACGNATRCVAWLFMQEKGAGAASIETKAGVLYCRAIIPIADMYAELEHIEVDIGAPRHVGALKQMSEFRAVYDDIDVGNPHIVFLADRREELDKIDSIGPQLQKDKNVSIIIIDPDPARGIRARVWERGVGRTASCGTAACASAIAAIRHNPRYAKDVRILQEMNGKSNMLKVHWGGKDEDHLFLSGPVQMEFEGELAL